MSTTISSPTDPAHRIDELVDQLVPRPGPPWRRFAAGLCLTALVVAGGLSWRQGLITPNPTSGISYSGGRQPTYSADRNAIAVSVYVPNHSIRSVRLTALTLRDAPGVQVVDVGARLQDEPDPSEENCITTGGTTSCAAAAVAVTPDEIGPWPSNVQPLPVTVPAGRSVDLYLLLDPTSCQGPDPDELPWGDVDATFDFGDGAFPGWSHTIRVEDALLETVQDARLSDDTGVQVYPPIDGRADDGAGWLAAACRLVQDG